MPHTGPESQNLPQKEPPAQRGAEALPGRLTGPMLRYLPGCGICCLG
jgi:hypothetical protein